MHEHDKITQRLGMLLTRLYSGVKLHLHELAAEYNVTLRTLQRDFNERLKAVTDNTGYGRIICITRTMETCGDWPSSWVSLQAAHRSEAESAQLQRPGG